jgi:hypothetical protein
MASAATAATATRRKGGEEITAVRSIWRADAPGAATLSRMDCLGPAPNNRPDHIVRAPWRRMILDPRLGAHLLCFELSDERSETRWERCRECVFVLELEAVRHEAALGCCGSR